MPYSRHDVLAVAVKLADVARKAVDVYNNDKVLQFAGRKLYMGNVSDQKRLSVSYISGSGPCMEDAFEGQYAFTLCVHVRFEGDAFLARLISSETRLILLRHFLIVICQANCMVPNGNGVYPRGCGHRGTF